MNGPQSFLATFLIQFHRVDNLDDMEAYISRIRESGRAGEQLLTIAKEAARDTWFGPSWKCRPSWVWLVYPSFS